MTTNRMTKPLTSIILTFWTSILLSWGQVQYNPTIVSSGKTVKMTDTERLLVSTLPFVEGLLKEHGEFFPLASAIMTNDSLAQVGNYNGDDKPLSNSVIADLKTAFRAKKTDYKTIAIFYDVRVVDPNTNLKTDAIAVLVETKDENTAYTFYYPYVLTPGKQLSFSDPWKNVSVQEIFND
jgi:hypothetical protein